MTNPETLVIVTAIALGIVALVFWIAMLIHCWKNRALGTEERLLWLALIVLGKVIGAGAYYLVRYRKAEATTVAEVG